MKMHGDLMSWANGDLDQVYGALIEQQSATTWKVWTWRWVLVLASAGVALSSQFRWIALAVAVVALERAIWQGREAATRNQLMHIVSIAKWRRRSPDAGLAAGSD